MKVAERYYQFYYRSLLLCCFVTIASIKTTSSLTMIWPLAKAQPTGSKLRKKTCQNWKVQGHQWLGVHSKCHVSQLTVGFFQQETKSYQQNSYLQGGLQVMCMQPWFFSIGRLHFGQGFELARILKFVTL